MKYEEIINLSRYIYLDQFYKKIDFIVRFIL